MSQACCAEGSESRPRIRLFCLRPVYGAENATISRWETVFIWCSTRRFGRCVEWVAAWSRLETFLGSQRMGERAVGDTACNSCSRPAVVYWALWLEADDWRSALEVACSNGKARRLPRALLCTLPWRVAIRGPKQKHSAPLCSSCAGVRARGCLQCRTCAEKAIDKLPEGASRTSARHRPTPSATASYMAGCPRRETVTC